jgi:hypothetical protein
MYREFGSTNTIISVVLDTPDASGDGRIIDSVSRNKKRIALKQTRTVIESRFQLHRNPNFLFGVGVVGFILCAKDFKLWSVV